MPLINFCGLPLSGKTQRAEQLKAAIEQWLKENKSSIRSVRVLNDEALHLDPKQSYQNANEEKKARANLMSAVERYLTKEDIVICDGLNYIKGYRYQLYCVARALGTPMCTVY